MADNTIRIAILANARDAVRQVNATARAMTRLDRQAKAGGVRAFASAAKAAAATARKLERETASAARAAAKLSRELRGSSRGLAGITRAAAGAVSALGRVTSAMGDVAKAAGSGALRGGGKALGIGLMGFVALGITAGVGQVASALATGLLATLPAVGVLPAFALAAASAFTVLKVATSGLADTVDLGLRAAMTGAVKDIKAYESAISKLSPEAQRLVRTMLKLHPALIEVRNAVSGAFLKGFSDEVQKLAGTYLPLLARHGSNVAASLNRAARELAAFARERSTVGKVADIFRDVERAISNVTAGLPNLARGFLPLLTVSATFLPSLTAGFAAATEQFAAFMKRAEESGALKSMIQGGLDALSSLFGLLADVGGILKSVFVDANKGGLSFFQVIADVVSQVDKFLNTAAGMDAVGAVWESLGLIGAALGDALKVVLPALGQALVALSPAIGPLADAMSKFLQTLAPLLPMAGKLAAAFGLQLAKVFDILGPVFLHIGTVVGALLTQLLPLMPVIAKLAAVVGKAFVAALVAVAPAIGPLVKSMAGFMTTLAPLLPIVGKLAAVFADQLAKALPILAPLLLDVGKVMAGLLTSMAPILPVIAEVAAVIGGAMVTALDQLMPVLGPLVKALGAGLLTVVTALAPILPVLAGVFAELVAAVTPLIAPLAAMIAQFVTGGLLPMITQLTPTVSALLAVLGPAMLTVLNAITPAIPMLTDAMLQLVPPIIQLLQAVIPVIPQMAAMAALLITKLMPVLVTSGPAMRIMINGLYLIVAAVRAGISIFETLTTSIGDLAGNVIDGFVSGLTSGWHRVTDFFSSAVEMIPDTIKNVLGMHSPSRVLTDLGINAGKSLGGGIKSQIPGIRKVMSQVSATVSDGVATDTAIKLRASSTVTTGSNAPAGMVTVNVTVANGADAAEVGRKTVAAIEAWQARTGRRRLLPA